MGVFTWPGGVLGGFTKPGGVTGGLGVFVGLSVGTTAGNVGLALTVSVGNVVVSVKVGAALAVSVGSMFTAKVGWSVAVGAASVAVSGGCAPAN